MVEEVRTGGSVSLVFLVFLRWGDGYGRCDGIEGRSEANMDGNSGLDRLMRRRNRGEWRRRRRRRRLRRGMMLSFVLLCEKTGREGNIIE